MSEFVLRLAAPVERYPVSRLNGPGLRWVLWTSPFNMEIYPYTGVQ